MEIQINGNRIAINQPTVSIAALLEHQGFTSVKGLAVAVNSAIIPRSRWDEVSVQSNDQILIITATQGG